MCGLEVNARVGNRSRTRRPPCPRKGVLLGRGAIDVVKRSQRPGLVGRGSRTTQSLPGAARLESKT
jgi:hypothetical protein